MSIHDYDKVYKLWTSTPGMGMNHLDDSRGGIEKYLMRNPNTCFVSEQADGTLDGVIMSGHDGRRGYIYHLAVSMESRGQGIGKGLLEHAVEALQQEGIQKAALVVFSDNEIGNQFWELQGFKVRNDLIYRNRVLDDE
ncbi:MAG TPA: GNAT family N-acetyltransferase [Candidatus Pelethocola excrementipullorum]|nr:GNAT family N-acetyltransferase [Candidatus Pelethocola excrementipullorum]